MILCGFLLNGLDALWYVLRTPHSFSTEIEHVCKSDSCQRPCGLTQRTYGRLIGHVAETCRASGFDLLRGSVRILPHQYCQHYLRPLFADLKPSHVAGLLTEGTFLAFPFVSVVCGDRG